MYLSKKFSIFILYSSMVLFVHAETTQSAVNNLPLNNTILVIDCGSNAHHIVSYIRSQHIAVDVCEFSTIENYIKKHKPRGIIISGSASCVADFQYTSLFNYILGMRVPMLGICYGMQLLCAQLGGKVGHCISPEWGLKQLKIVDHCELTQKAWPSTITMTEVRMGHNDRVEELPTGFKTIASTAQSPHAFVADDVRRYYGVQFHPESPLCINEKRVLKAFLDIIGAKATIFGYVFGYMHRINSLIKSGLRNSWECICWYT